MNVRILAERLTGVLTQSGKADSVQESAIMNKEPFINRLAVQMERFGMGWFVPFVLLLAWQEPKAQVDRIVHSFLMPFVAFAVFLLLWTIIAKNSQVRTGKLPTPYEVALEAKALWDEHLLEGQKAKEFYERQEERKAKYLAQFPDKEFKERMYSGKDTFIDQIGTSLKTVFAGFFLASIVAVPFGLLCGLSRNFYQSVNPLVQIFKPVSPLAWLPIVMILVSAWYNPEEPMFEKSFLSSAIVVSLCSLWPTLINTANGVVNVNPDYMNVAKVLKLGFFSKIFKIVIPAALPYIFTGLRLSLGIGWMVLIAAEMLSQNPGLGKFIWDMFQNGSSQTLAQIIVAVFTIGAIGFLLDRIMISMQKMVSFDTTVEVR